MTSSNATASRAGDRITGRIFGQYLTMQRCDWEALAQGDPDMLKRAAEIALRPADEPRVAE